MYYPTEGDMTASMFEWLRGEVRNLRFVLLGGVVESMTDTMQAAAAHSDVDDALTAICESTARAVGCDRVSIFLSDGSRHRARYNYGNPPEIAARFPRHSVRLDDPLLTAAAERGGCVVVNDVTQSDLVYRPTAKRASIRAIAVALMFDRVADDEVVGFVTLEFNERRGRITPLYARLLQGSARIAEILVANDRAAAARAKLETRLQELENVESIARMCGGIAHDVNNALTVIVGNAEFLERSMPRGAEQLEAYRQLTVAVSHATSLARNLLAFGHLTMGRPEVIDLNDEVRRLEPLLISYVPPELSVVYRLEAENGFVDIDPGQLEQVLINLLGNAADASAGAGQVEIGTRDVGDHVVLSVTDEGPGFGAGEFERALEPFYSTKDSEGHSGIGLATVSAIVKSAHGSIGESSDGDGARIEVTLPRSQAKPEPRAAGDRDEVPDFDWSAMKVLVVDDHPNVLHVAANIMRRRGCNVRVAQGGEAALELLAVDPDLDLLITDIRMPGMDGGELARRVRGLAPFVGVVYMSGFAEPDVLDRTMADDAAALIFKPFTADQLLMRAYQSLTR